MRLELRRATLRNRLDVNERVAASIISRQLRRVDALVVADQNVVIEDF